MSLRSVGVAGAIVAAVAWTFSGLVALVSPGSNFGPVGSQSWFLIEASDAIAEAGMLASLMGILSRGGRSRGALLTIGFVIAFLGTLSVLLSTVLWLLARGGESAAIDLLFSLGGLAVLIGYPLVGVAILRERVLPRWVGILLVAWLLYFPAIFFLLDFFGEARILLGLVWVAVARGLMQDVHGSQRTDAATVRET